MELSLMNMIVDENKVVTAVTLSRRLHIMTDEATKAMVEFYDKHKTGGDIWATFIVYGSREKFGVPVRSSVLCRDEDVEKVKAQFKTVHSVKLFSLQTVKIEDLNSLLVGDRLEDQKFFRSDAERSLIRSKLVRHFAEELCEKLQSGNSDVLIAMRHLLGDAQNQKSPAKVASSHSPKKGSLQPQKLDNLFKKACERQKTPKSTPKKEARKSPWSSEKAESLSQSTDESVESTDIPLHNKIRRSRNSQKEVKVEDDDSPVEAASKQTSTSKKNLSSKFSSTFSKTKKLNKDIFDDEDSSPEKSNEVKEKSPDRAPEKPNNANKRKLSPAPSKKLKEAFQPPHDCEDSQESAASSDGDHIPAKKKKMVKTVETYQDEDGFLVTKEVVNMVETDEPEEPHSKPLRPANNNKVSQAAHHKKKSAAAAGTQKISAFFTKK
ncbi:hypothetical protein RB195_021489 [Necator americanus]|uniref:DNA polymerase delta subunit 3 n=1 Tax=Necator americanus TaxID=51031 RepID=A0ABR1EBY6_NECAM